MSYLFLLEDLEVLDKKIKENKERMEDALKRIGDSCDGGSSWHDNFPFEQAQRDAELWSTRTRGLIAIRNNAEVVYPGDFSDDEVNIGRFVTIRDEDSGGLRTFQIGSYMILDDERNAVSYNTPLVKLILGAKIGELREGEIVQKKRKFRIVKIK